VDLYAKLVTAVAMWFVLVAAQLFHSVLELDPGVHRPARRPGRYTWGAWAQGPLPHQKSMLGGPAIRRREKSHPERPSQSFVAVPDETPGQRRSGSLRLERVADARIDMQFGGNSGLLEPLGVLDVLVDELLRSPTAR
jgi:hypothetical protein